MHTIFDRRQNAMLKRTLNASLVAFVIFGGGFLWHNVSAERTAARAEQARLATLRMTPKKLAALEREARNDAAAKAFAEKQEAEEQARVQAQRIASSTKG